MKYKAFLVLIVLGFTFGTMAMANYIDPTNSAPADPNTPVVVKTGPGANVSGTRPAAIIKSKIGIGDGINLTQSNLLTNGSYIGTGFAGNGSTGDKGGFIEKLVVMGATGVVGGSSPKNILVQINDVGTNKGVFDQYRYGTQYEYPFGASKRMTRALEAIVAGRYISKIMVTSSPDTQNNDVSEPLSLKLQATTGSNAFLPTTNIGLGNTCNLYAGDLGTTVADGGGCPAGSYMSWYKAPTISGTVDSSNNNNGVTFATCTEFNPATSPTNTGHCSTGRPSGVTVSWASQVPDKCRISIPSQCWSPTAYYYKESGWTNWVGYSGVTYGDCSSFTPGRTYAFDGTCPSGSVMTQPASFAVDSYKTIHSVNINNSVLKMPTTLSGNIKWYYGTGPTEATTERDKTQAEGNNIDRVRITDLYGQYIERTK